MHLDVVAAGVDAYLFNTLALAMINQDYDFNWLACLCLSCHAANNSGDKAKFVMLNQFWILLQKIFIHSDKGKGEVIWERVNRHCMEQDILLQYKAVQQV
jgi:hypothetical protein